jgi:hypothetical protein
MTTFRKPTYRETPPPRPRPVAPKGTPKEEFDLFGFVGWMARRWWDQNKNKPLSPGVGVLAISIILFTLFFMFWASIPNETDEQRQARHERAEREYYDRKVKEDEERNFQRLYEAAKRYEAEQRRGWR